MNVQTLPPGYKTAPWTPPDKITGEMLADASGKLIELLRIRTQPIGMRLFEDPKDMEAIKGVRKPTDGFKFTMCQMVTQSRWYGFTLGITVDTEARIRFVVDNQNTEGHSGIPGKIPNYFTV